MSKGRDKRNRNLVVSRQPLEPMSKVRLRNRKDMPKSKKFNKLLRSCKKQYGKKKGTSVAYATAKKKGWRT
jgi:hypothetical protein